MSAPAPACIGHIVAQARHSDIMNNPDSLTENISPVELSVEIPSAPPNHRRTLKVINPRGQTI